jgi:hypothetical protein
MLKNRYLTAFFSTFSIAALMFSNLAIQLGFAESIEFTRVRVFFISFLQVIMGFLGFFTSKLGVLGCFRLIWGFLYMKSGVFLMCSLLNVDR